MAYEKTIWKNRLVEKPRTFRQQQNTDGTVTLVPEEGQIHEAGTPVNAANLQKIEDAVAAQDEAFTQHLGKKGQPNGYASLDANGKVPNSQLNISINNASTTQNGIVRLSNDTNSASETLAPTMKALNEVKLLANDIKTKWATVVGAPLTSSDTQAQLQTKTQTIIDTFKANLNAKGVATTPDEKLSSLVGKVNNITQIREASGSVRSSSTKTNFALNGATFSSEQYSVTVPSPGFIPRVIRVAFVDGSRREFVDWWDTTPNSIMLANSQLGNSGSANSYSAYADSAYVNSVGFCFPVSQGNTIYTWYAYG